jgi:error-prone DNA polymerase
VSYVELHCHSCFSLREGSSTPLELLVRARNLGYRQLALTDHDNLVGAMQFAQTAKDWDVRPITGAEITLEGDHHLTLLAATSEGYGNLCRLLTEANLSSPRGEPRVRLTSLAEHSSGLIALSGCRNGTLVTLAESGEVRQATEAAERFASVFGKESFYVELQRTYTFEDEARNTALVDIARDLRLGLVATNNVHYHVPERARLHDVLVAVRHRMTLEDARPFSRVNGQHYLKPPEQMAALFADLPEAIENTSEIAERCSFDITRDLTYEFPDYQAGDGRSADEFIRDLCFQRARERYRSNFPEVEARLNKELDLIRDGRRAGFFLRLWEIIEVAHERKFPVRGRGSSVGSLVCFLLGLSGIDPIRYNLPVERFLNPERLREDPPDVDLDLGRDARDQLFGIIFDRYGTSHAAQVASVIEYHYPSAIRDVGLALGLAPGDIDKLAKLSRSRFFESLDAEMASLPEFVAKRQAPIWREFVQLVEELRGMPRHLSQHSGGIVISTTRIDEQVPVSRAAMPGRFIGDWDKDSVADAGFFKLDLLGYPTLDQIELALSYIFERYGKLIRPEDIDLTDQAVYAMIQRAGVMGVVQIQSRAQQQILLRIEIRNIEELAIQIALIRPGPIQGHSVNPYVARRLGLEPITYDHPCIEPVLAETLGVIVYQEQVLGVAMALAGFSSGNAEKLRRAMSRKRSQEAMEALREEFLDGARRNGVSRETAVTVFEKIVAFSAFGFPKSHSMALAQTAFQAAWLRLYYRAEFHAALLNCQPMGFYTPEVLCNDARRDGIEILPIEVNESEVDCSVERDDAVRLGFRYVAGLGPAALERLRQDASNGGYFSLWEFWRRTQLPRAGIENLIRLGAFSFTGMHERELLWQLGTFYRPLNQQQPLALSFNDARIGLREMTHRERVATDLALSGIAVRGHSMDLVDEQLHEGIVPSHLVEKMEHGQPVTVGGLVAVRQAPETAKGFVFHSIEDRYGLVNVITRPSLVPKFRRLVESAPALIVHGHIERQQRAVNVIAERFEPLSVGSDLERRVHNFG